jgi:uncharacterized RDD family membrane protein YckC
MSTPSIYSSYVSPEPNNFRYDVWPGERAGLFDRWLASFIDQVIVGLVTGFIVLLVGSLSTDWPGDVGVQPLALLLPVAYYVWFFSESGQTPGKKLLKIKVIVADGGSLGWGRALLRTIGYGISALPLGLGYLWALWDAKGQAWHDKIAGTCVVPESFDPSTLRGHVDMKTVRTQQVAWLLVTGALSSCILASTLGPIAVGAVQATSNLGEWPGHQYTALEIIRLDLSSLGLSAGQVQDIDIDEAHRLGWLFQDAAAFSYTASGQLAVMLVAYKYEDRADASDDFSGFQAQAQQPGACAWNTYAYFWMNGILRCRYADAYQEEIWHDGWIIEILGMDGSKLDAEALVAAVRQELAAHWAGMPDK